MKKAKKSASFAKIYVMSIVIFVFISLIFFLVLAVFLNSYEATADQRRIEERQAAESARIAAEESRNAESERIKNELENEKLNKEKDFKERQAKVESEAGEFAAAVKDATARLVSANAAAYLDGVVATLDKDGSSLLTAYLKDGLSRYEKEDALTAYIDLIAGDYSYEMTSALTAVIKKGAVRFDITLEETEKDGFVPEYSIKDVSCSYEFKTFTVTAPGGSSLLVNGAAVTEITSSAKTGKTKDVPDIFEPPVTDTYVLPGFVNEPRISVSLGGAELTCEKTGRTFSYKAAERSDADLYKEALTPRILELMYSYTDFIAGVYKFSAVKSGFYPDTKLYTALSSFDNRWYYTYDYIQNENAAVSGLTVLSDRLISVHVVFDQMLYDETGKRLRRVPMKFDVLIGCTKDPAIPAPEGKTYKDWVLISVE